jgi:hypothetical protein
MAGRSTAYGERHSRFCRNHSFLFSGCYRNAGSGSSARCGSDQRSFTPSGNPADKSPGSRTTANLREVALLVALATESVRSRSNRLTIH